MMKLYSLCSPHNFTSGFPHNFTSGSCGSDYKHFYFIDEAQSEKVTCPGSQS